MKTRAAIAWEPNRPLEIEEIDLDGPKAGEVLVRIVTSVQPGDHVIPLYTPEDPNCPYIRSGKTNLCQTIRETQGRGKGALRTLPWLSGQAR